MIKLLCNACGKKLTVADRHAGARVKCPGCQSSLRVPSATGGAASTAAPPSESARARASASAPSYEPTEPPGEDNASDTRLLVMIGSGAAGAILIGAVVLWLLIGRSDGPAAPQLAGDETAGNEYTATNTDVASPTARPRRTGGAAPRAVSLVGPIRAEAPGAAIVPLGDITRDGYTDFVVSAAQQHFGGLAAYAGRDGSILWQAAGRTASDGGPDGYFIKDIVIIPDHNGDGTPDIYAQEAWYKNRVLIFSGRDGRLLVHQLPPSLPTELQGPTGRLDEASRLEVERLRRDAEWAALNPARVEDVTGDGQAEWVRHVQWRDPEQRTLNLARRAYSSRDFSLLHQHRFEPPEGAQADWVLHRFPDSNGDGVDDVLVSVRAGVRITWHVLDGRTLEPIRQIEPPSQRRTGRTRFVGPGDLNGDGIPDIVYADTSGGEEIANHSISFIAAVCGATGQVIWRNLGNAYGDGARLVMVDATTGQRSDSMRDVQFGSMPVLVVGDIDGDGVADLAVPIITDMIMPGPPHDILLVSGATGATIARISLPGEFGRITGPHLARLDSIDGAGTPGVIINGIDPATQPTLFILPLESR